MSCQGIRARLSEYRDGELAGETERMVSVHLDGCPPCAEHWRSLEASLALLAELPRLEAPEPVAARVFDRLELERGGPGLALLFRAPSEARPLILASLFPAACVFALALSAAIALDRVPKALYAAIGADTRPGSERNPLFPSAGVSVPQLQGPALASDLVAGMDEGSLFFQTVVARDGSVSAVTLLQGDVSQAGPLIDALRRERFAPGRYRGRPVAVSLYRLISRMDVRPPTI